jgi:hypothetical protein
MRRGEMSKLITLFYNEQYIFMNDHGVIALYKILPPWHFKNLRPMQYYRVGKRWKKTSVEEFNSLGFRYVGTI